MLLSLSLLALALAAQLQIPPPIGYVNDFANVIDPRSEQAMLALIEEVRSKSGGEIAVVTLPDLAGRTSLEVARDIGRQWRVGARGGPGERARNAGVVLLLKPGRRPGDGQAELAIATGTGAEGFITDARAGRIRDAIGEAAVRSGSYAAGLLVGVRLLAEAYAQEFGFELTGLGSSPQRPTGGGEPGAPGSAVLFWLLLILGFFLIVTATIPRRYRRAYGHLSGPRYHGPSAWEWFLLGTLLRERRSGRHSTGGWFGGFGGGGFGGFGGFGGGGGFSGGGASGRF